MGLLSRRSRGWPDNARRVTVTRYVGDPTAEAMAGSVDRLYGRAMAGANGFAIIGEPADPARRFSGYLAPLQRFTGGARLGTQRPLRSMQPALPNTHPPIGAGGSAMVDLIGATQGI